jgi:predicted transcriptional regulator
VREILPMSATTKQQVQEVLDQLPDDCTLEDVQYELYVIQKVQRGLQAVERGDVVTHEEAKKRLERWLTR